jgi:enoyl-CoA hydratase/carnithine racemase
MIHAQRATHEDLSIACAVVTGAGDKSFSAGSDFYAMKRRFQWFAPKFCPTSW